MPEFHYTARDAGGAQRAGSEVASSKEELVRMLRQQGLLVLEVRLAEAAAAEWSLNPLDYQPLHSVDVERSLHQIAVLLRSGVNILEALEFTRDFARPGARKTWRIMAERIASGSSLSEAMAEHRVFSDMTKQLVQVGEQSGRLDQAIEHASKTMERSRVNRRQVLSALQYPAFMILFAIGIVAFMLKKLIPELKKFLSVMGRKLPAITQSLIDVSNWLQTYMPVIILTTLLTLAFLILLYQWPKARFWMDRIALSLPVFGHLFRLSGTVNLTMGLGVLLLSGVRILDALVTVEKMLGNRYLASRIDYVRQRVEQGSSLAEPLAEEDAFMSMLPRMIRVGEKSGSLDLILEEMERHYADELQRYISWLSSLIAPTMTVVVGGIIGYVYAAFLVAMFSAGATPR